MKDKVEENNDVLYFIISEILVMISTIPSIIVLISYISCKIKKSKEDIMNIQKLYFKIFLFIFYLFMVFIIRVNEDEILIEYFSWIQSFIFNLCLLSISLIDLKINFIKFMKYYDPSYLIKDFISEKSKNYSYEIFYISFSFVFIGLSLYFNKDVMFEVDIKDSTKSRYLLSTFFIVYPICIIIVILTSIFKIKKLLLINSISKNFSFDSQVEKEIKSKYNIELFEVIFICLNFLYYICSLVQIFFIFNYNESINNQIGFLKYFDIVLKLNNIFFILIGLFEGIYFMFYTSRTDFYKFTLGNTAFASFYKIFKPEIYERPILSIETSDTNYNNIYCERMRELNNTCIFFHNNLSFSIDEHFINIFDYSVNIVLATISKILKNKLKLNEKEKSCSKNKKNIHNKSDVPYSKGNLAHFENDQNKNKNFEAIDSTKHCNSTRNMHSEINLFDNGKNRENKLLYFTEEDMENESHKNNLKSKNNNEHKNLIIDNEIDINLIPEKIQDLENNNKSIFEIYKYVLSSQKNDFQDEKLIKLLHLKSDRDSSNCNTSIQNNNDEDVLSRININITAKEYYSEEMNELLKIKKIDYNSLEKSILSHYNAQQQNFTSLFSLNARDELFRRQENLVIRTSDKLFNFEFLNSSDDNLDEHNGIDGNLLNYLDYVKRKEITFLPYILGVFKIKINEMKEIKVVITKNNLIDEIPKENFNYWQLLRMKEEEFEMISSSKVRQSLLVSDEILIKNETKFNLANFSEFIGIYKSDLNFLRQIKSDKFSLMIMYYEIGKNSIHNSQYSNDENKFYSRDYNGGRISNLSKNGNNNISVIKPIENSIFDFSLKNDINLMQLKNGFECSINEFKCVLFFLFDNIFVKKKNFLFNICNNKHERFINLAKNRFEENKINIFD